MKRNSSLLTAAILLGSASFLTANTVIFSDVSWSEPETNSKVGDTSGLNYYGSSGSSGQLSLSGSDLVLTTATSGRGLLVNFPSVVNLGNVGDSLTASVTFQITTPIYTAGSNNFRLALGNSNSGTQISANGYGNTNASFAGYTGYLAGASVGAADNNPGILMRKIASADAIIGTTTSRFDTIADGGIDATPANAPELAEGIDYTTTISITRLASGVTIDYMLQGGSLNGDFDVSFDDLTDPVFSFDLLALHINSNVWTTLNIGSVNVTTLAAVPEPSAFGLILGGSILLLVTHRRRRAT